MSFPLLKELVEQASHIELARGFPRIVDELKMRALLSKAYVERSDLAVKNALKNASVRENAEDVQ